MELSFKFALNLMIFLLLALALESVLSAGKSNAGNYKSAWITNTIPPLDKGFTRASSIVLKGREPRLFVVGGEEDNIGVSRMSIFNINKSSWIEESIPIPLVEPKLTTTNNTLWIIGGIQIEGSDGQFAKETNRVFLYRDGAWLEKAGYRINYSAYGYSVCSSRNVIYHFNSLSTQSLDANDDSSIWKEETTFPPFPAKFYRIATVCTSRYAYHADFSNYTGFWRLDFQKRLVTRG
jgi:hypothetical protein